MNDIAIELKNITKTYNKKEDITVLNNLSYAFYKNNFYSIMGESGSGKSTLVNIMCGLIKKDSGEIIYFNDMIPKNINFDWLRNKRIGLIYQTFLLNDDLTAYDNVLLPLMINNNYSKSEKDKLVKDALNKVGLSNRINHYPKELSGGEAQRVAIARALINNPDIIIADEPTGNLDKKNEKIIFDILKKESLNGKCVIVVSHNEDIKKYSNINLLLKNGILYEE